MNFVFSEVHEGNVGTGSCLLLDTRRYGSARHTGVRTFKFVNVGQCVFQKAVYGEGCVVRYSSLASTTIQTLSKVCTLLVLDFCHKCDLRLTKFRNPSGKPIKQHFCQTLQSCSNKPPNDPSGLNPAMKRSSKQLCSSQPLQLPL